MDEYVIFAVSVVSTSRPIRRWLKSFDPEAHDGRGFADFTDNPHEALRFPSLPGAMVSLMQQPESRPLREDGLPNRPLRTFSVLIQTTHEAEEMAASLAKPMSTWPD